MILKEKTKNQFGYIYEQLTNGSNKKIYIQCDYCNKIYTKSKKLRVSQNKVINKDACIKCRYKKREEISLKQYGVKNSAQRPDVLGKLRSVNIDNYHDEIIELNNQGYSIQYIADKLNIPSTSLNRYFSKEKIGRNDVEQSRQKTQLEKYGETHYLKTEEGQERVKNTNRKKYGVDNVFQNEEIKEKSRQTCLNKYGVDHYNKLEGVAKESAKKCIETKKRKGIIKLYEGKTITELSKESEYSRSHLSHLIKKYGIEKASSMTPHQSELESIFENWLKEDKIPYKKQVKVENKIADFKIDKLIIELDGLYWHSDSITTDNDYHVDKRSLYIKNGFTPLFFRQDEIQEKFNIVKSIINNKLGKSSRIFARNCIVKSVSPYLSSIFLNKNHLMGSGRGVHFALYNNHEIVGILSMRKIKDNFYDISRFATKLNTSIVGGFSKLLKYFIRQNNPYSIQTFIDLRYGIGSYLSDLGFKHISINKSFKWTNGNKTFHRLKFRGNSGYKNGMAKIWDCGQSKWEITL